MLSIRDLTFCLSALTKQLSSYDKITDKLANAEKFPNTPWFFKQTEDIRRVIYNINQEIQQIQRKCLDVKSDIKILYESEGLVIAVKELRIISGISLKEAAETVRTWAKEENWRENR